MLLTLGFVFLKYLIGDKTGTPAKRRECVAAILEKDENPMVLKSLKEMLQSYFHRIENPPKKEGKSQKKTSLQSRLYRRL